MGNNRVGVGIPNYGELQEAGDYIGTGLVEKAGKTVVVQLRLKRLNGDREG